MAETALAPSADAAEVLTNRIFFSSGTRYAWLYADDLNTLHSETFETGFYARMQAWLDWTYANTPLSWKTPFYIYNLGAKVDKPGAHRTGNAFDICRFYVTINGSLTLVGSMHYDQWKNSATDVAAQSTTRKRYWAFAASIIRRVYYVLHYEYNSDHWSHIHADNVASGAGDTYFSINNTSQVKFVQASLRHVWGYYISSIDGSWSTQTDTAVRAALARTGGSGSLPESTANWWRYCEATAKFGWGTSTY